MNEEQRRADEKAVARKSFERMLRRQGRLSNAEIFELVAFEFEVEADTVAKQVRRYYLTLKSERPDRAEAMLRDVGDVSETSLNETRIQELVMVIRRYISGIVIHYKGSSYTERGMQKWQKQ